MLILAFIGITEGLLNTLFHRMVYPWMNQVFGLNSYLESISLSEIGALMAKSVFFFCADKLLGAFPVGIRQYLRGELSEWAGEDWNLCGKYARKSETSLYNRTVWNFSGTASVMADSVCDSGVCVWNYGVKESGRA